MLSQRVRIRLPIARAPVRKSRTFYVASFEISSSETEESRLLTVPASAPRQMQFGVQFLF